MSVFKRYELQFFTATILEWKPLLQLDKYKDIIIDSLKFLVKDGRVAIHGFVIMNNHFRRCWCFHQQQTRNVVQVEANKQVWKDKEYKYNGENNHF